jgi:hypothetical protein
MYAPSTCAEQVKREYLITTNLPPATSACAADDDPFQGPAQRMILPPLHSYI